MSLNWKEIDLILDELPLESSLMQKAVQNSFHSLMLEFYHPVHKRWRLYIDLSQAYTRLHRTERSFSAGQKKLQRFPQMFRSRLIGGIIRSAEQLHQDRIVKLTIDHGGSRYFMFIRLWGGASNIIVTDSAHVIIDCFYRRPKRQEVSGETYQPELQMEQKAAGKHSVEFTVRSHDSAASFNSYIDKLYYTKELKERMRQLKEQAVSLLSSREGALMKRLAGLEKKADLTDSAERSKQLGDLISANAYRIHKGDTQITLEDFYQGDTPITVTLDPSRNPIQNAEYYYKEHSKQKSAEQYIHEEIENCRRQLNQITADRKAIDTHEDNPEEAVRLLQEITARYREQKKRGNRQESGEDHQPGLQFVSSDFTILVGRTAKENDQLLRKFTRGNDYWLHARDYPGGYVFIKYKKGKSVPLETLLDAGNLALFFSKGRSNGKGDLYYTQVKYLRRAKHGKLGLVIPTQEKNLSVELDQNRIEKLFAGSV